MAALRRLIVPVSLAAWWVIRVAGIPYVSDTWRRSLIAAVCLGLVCCRIDLWIAAAKLVARRSDFDVYEIPLSRTIYLPGGAICLAGTVGYVGQSSRGAVERWSDPSHPVQSDWGRKWLDPAGARVHACASEQAMDFLEKDLIQRYAAVGHRLFNEVHNPTHNQIPKSTNLTAAVG